MPLLRIRQKLAVKRDDDAMVSIVIYYHVTIKAKVNGAHDGVSTLLVNEIFQCGTVRVDHLMKAIQNRIGVALVRVLGEESRLLCRDSQSLGKLLGIFFRYELLSHLQRETDSVEHVFRNHEADCLLGIDHLADTHVGHKR